MLAYTELTGRQTAEQSQRSSEIIRRAEQRAAAGDSVGRIVDAVDRLTGAVLHDDDDENPVGQ